MLILQLSPRNVSIHGTPSYPCDASLEAELLPKELFGVEKLSGRLPLARPGEQVTLVSDDRNGGIRLKVNAALESLALETTFGGLHVIIRHGRLTVKWRCTSAEHLVQVVTETDVLLPSLLAAAVPSPVALGELIGTVGEAGVTYTFRGAVERTLHAPTAQVLATSMAKRLVLFRRASEKTDVAVLVSAHRYLNQARRLGYVSDYSTEFIGERLLNLYKAIEVIFGRQADGVRTELTRLRVDPTYQEALFVALVFVRDSLDVGHPALHPLDPDDWQRLHSFAERAEHGVTWLLRHVTEEAAEGRYRLRSVKKSNSKLKLLETLKKHDGVRIPEPYGKGA